MFSAWSFVPFPAQLRVFLWHSSVFVLTTWPCSTAAVAQPPPHRTHGAAPPPAASVAVRDAAGASSGRRVAPLHPFYTPVHPHSHYVGTACHCCHRFPPPHTRHFALVHPTLTQTLALSCFFLCLILSLLLSVCACACACACMCRFWRPGPGSGSDVRRRAGPSRAGIFLKHPRRSAAGTAQDFLCKPPPFP